MPIYITATGDPHEVQAIADAFRAAGPATIVFAPDPTPAAVSEICPICRMPYDRGQAQNRLLEEDRICNLCQHAAVRIVRRFKEDGRRHQQDFLNNLRQMVRDVRSGAEDPTFYRGWE